VDASPLALSRCNSLEAMPRERLKQAGMMIETANLNCVEWLEWTGNDRA